MGGTIRVGIGGWDFEPWKESFFPPGTPKAKWLTYASRTLTTIEVNGTYYRTQTPSTFAKWRDTAPDGFVYSIKALRFTTNRRVLAEAGESVGKFLSSGLSELGDKLGPILWQFAPTKTFDADDFGAFLALLPESQDGVRLRHALEVRNDSFRDPAFVALAKKHGAAIVYAHASDYPEIADPTAAFVYARLQGCREDEPTGYSHAELDRWAKVARTWADGGAPADLPYVTEAPAKASPREVFVYFISGAKVRAPAAATTLIQNLTGPASS